jgi:hypothetical protein
LEIGVEETLLGGEKIAHAIKVFIDQINIFNDGIRE